MKPILLDTNGCAAFKRGLPDAISIVHAAPTIGMSSVVLGELLGGFAAGTQEQRNRAQLKESPDSSQA